VVPPARGSGAHTGHATGGSGEIGAERCDGCYAVRRERHELACLLAAASADLWGKFKGIVSKFGVNLVYTCIES
jgi:hypothetical protein